MPSTTALRLRDAGEPEKWAEVRAVLRETGNRFADLTLAVPDPSGPRSESFGAGRPVPTGATR